MTAIIFQRDEDDADQLESLEKIAYVNVRRCVRGTWESVPRQYTVEEMGTEEQLYEALGAGQYELIGRDDRNARIIRRQKVNIARAPGDPGPQVQATQPVMMAPQAESGGGSDRMFLAVMQMMQQQNAVMMQAQSQQMTALVTMVTGVLQASRQGAEQQTQQMAAMFSQFGGAQAEMFKTMLSQAGSGAPQQTFLEGIKTAIELQQGMKEEKDAGGAGDLTELMAAVEQGAKAFATVKGAAGTAATEAT